MKSEVIRVLPQLENTAAEDAPVVQHLCFYCGTSHEVLLCNWCRQIYYCRKHHSIHRSRSKCFPFIVSRGGLRGRRLLASRDIKPGELILQETPAIVAPAPRSTPVCVSCLGKIKNLDEDKCLKCHLPVCSQRCQEGPIHQPECKIYSTNKVKVKLKANEPNDFYTNIAPIRFLHLKNLGESTEDQTVPLLELPDHAEERSQFAKSEWNMIELEVVEFLRARCFLKNELSAEELHKLSGIFMVNSINVSKGKGLYPIFSTVNHDCLSNAKFKVDPDSWILQLKAQSAIKKGQEITVQYLSTILGTHKRRKKIKSEWYFECECQRCSDPTENDTFVSALICEACEEDYLLPTEPLDVFSSWTCGSCDFFLSCTDVEAKIDVIEDELSIATNKRDLKLLEDFVRHYSGQILHPNHYLLLLAKRNYIFISRKNLIELMTQCTLEEQQELKSAFKTKHELYREFSWIPEKLFCSDTF